jgi:ABC-2 type transport system ATP-binding protein
MYHEGATEPRDCAERGDSWEALAVALATIPESVRAEQTTIEISGLRKQFGRVTALDDLDLLVPRAAVGLLGANGAGKTTLLRVLLGLTDPTRGSASVLGLDTRTQSIQIRERVGFMPESSVLPTGTTAADFLGHMAQMSGLPARAAKQRAADVLYQVGLDEERYRLIKGLSTGMKQRVKLAQAIVHDPELLFLDEPTIGMDPQGRDDMLDLIDRIYRGLGIAVVVSSHLLEDIERVCDHVVILDAGKLVLAQPIDRAGAEHGDLRIRVQGDVDAFIRRLADAGVQVSRAHPQESASGDELVVRLTGDHVYDVVRDAAADLGVALRSLRTSARSLEDIYLGQVQGPTTTGGPDVGP